MKVSSATIPSRARAAQVAVLLAVFAANLSYAEVGKEEFKGTCEQLNDFIQRAGVTDAGNQNHPRSAGWSTFEVTAASLQMTFQSQRKEGQVCVEARPGQTGKMFSLRQRSTRLDWQPFGSISNACLAEKTRWEKATEEHERQRLASAEGIVHRYNKQWSAGRHTYRACAESEAVAREKAGQQAEKDAKQLAERVKAEVQALPDASPGPAAGANAAMDCSQCR